MVRVEERVAHLEGQMNQLVQGLSDVTAAIGRLDQRIDARFAAIDARFAAIDARFAAIDARFEAVDRRFDALDAKMSRQFVWLVGIIVTTLAAMAGAVLSRT